MSVASMLRGVERGFDWVTATGLREKARQLDVGSEMQKDLIEAYQTCHRALLEKSKVYSSLYDGSEIGSLFEHDADGHLLALFDALNKTVDGLHVRLKTRFPACSEQWLRQFFPRINKERSGITHEKFPNVINCLNVSEALRHGNGPEPINSADAWFVYERAALMRPLAVGVLGTVGVGGTGFGLHHYLTSDKA